MAAVHTLVQTPSSSAAASLISPSSSHAKLGPLPSLALNKHAPLPPVDVPIIELDHSQSDLDASGEGPRGGRREDHNQSGSFDESADAAATSVELDRQRLAEVDRMIASYKQQGVVTGAVGVSSSTSSANASQANSRANSVHQSREDFDGLDTSSFGKPAAVVASTKSPRTAEEDEYADDDFAASDVVGASGIEESLEVEEEESVANATTQSGTRSRIGMGGAEDSLDAEYFNSNSSLVDQGARKQTVGSLGAGRRAQIPASISSADHSYSSVDEHSASMDEERDRRGGPADAPRDVADAYSEDQSLNEPLEDQFDYTEDVEPV